MIKAIETRYAGCRFRSRLEARWAVFFDHAGIPWEYEPEGMEISSRLGFEDVPPSYPYLPDFYLTGLRLWAEVKGQLTQPELLTLLNSAAALSSPSGGCGGGHDLLVLGGIPEPFKNVVPYRLHMHKGDLSAGPWGGANNDWCGAWDEPSRYICNDSGEVPQRNWAKLLLEGYSQWQFNGGLYNAALTAARSARFEHGEKG